MGRDDLLNDDEDEIKQRRVLNCVLELAFTVSSMENYIGPQLDMVNLGVLAKDGFFGELSLLPIAGGWQHTRTAIATLPSRLYFLSMYY